jgi:hypothetical protein
MPVQPSRARRNRADFEREAKPFTSFLERDVTREKRRISRRNTVVISLAIHIFAVLVVVVYSIWHVDELWSPSVKVTMFGPRKTPAAVVAPLPGAAAAPLPQPAKAASAPR